MQVGKKSASFDGNADKLVYYYSAAELNVIGGERLNVLYTAAIKKLMADEGVCGKSLLYHRVLLFGLYKLIEKSRNSSCIYTYWNQISA